MAHRILKTDKDRAEFIKFMGELKLPVTMEWHGGAGRSLEQNRLQRLWCNEVADQLGDTTPEEVRGLSKLQIAVPILRAEDEDFCEAYDKAIKPLPYETKIACMMEPIDFPVTRRMSVAQKKRFLDEMHRYWSEKGLRLTDPDLMERNGK